MDEIFYVLFFLPRFLHFVPTIELSWVDIGQYQYYFAYMMKQINRMNVNLFFIELLRIAYRQSIFFCWGQKQNIQPIRMYIYYGLQYYFDPNFSSYFFFFRKLPFLNASQEQTNTFWFNEMGLRPQGRIKIKMRIKMKPKIGRKNILEKACI